MKRLMIGLLCLLFMIVASCATLSPIPKETENTDPTLLNDEIIQMNENSTFAATRSNPVTGTKTMLVTVTHWQGEKVLNKAEVEKHTISNDPDSLRSYIMAASGGKLNLQGRVVEAESGPRPESCGMSTSIDEGLKTANANGLNPDDFDYLINVINCPGGGASAHAPGRITGVYGKAGGPHVYKHEFGHNLGYSHGSTYIGCPSDGNTVTAPGGCSLVEYGDTGDSVSGGGTLYPAINRLHSGWLDEGQAVTINRTGLYSLGVLGREGPQLYLIKIPDYTSTAGSLPLLTLEYRKPTAFDNFPEGDNRVNGVWMRYSTDSGNVLNRQIDATPQTAITTDPTLQAGHTFEDDSGKVKVRVCSTSDQEAIIAVALNGAAFPYCSTTVPPPIIQAPIEGAKTGKQPVFAGTSWPGARIVISSPDNPGQALGSTVADGNGRWSVYMLSVHELGNYAYTATQYFGPRHSTASNVRSFQVADMEVLPAVIESPAENIRTGRRPIVSGMGIPGATVVLLKAYDPYNALATTRVDGFGQWAVQVEQPLPISPPVFNMTGYQTLDGKKSYWLANRQINIVDQPDPAIIETPAENISTGRYPVVSGKGIAGATVTLLKAGDPYNALASTVVDGHGHWTVPLTRPLPVSPPVFTMTGYQTLEGKRSYWLANRRINVVDIPSPAIIETPAQNVKTGRKPIVSGKGIAGATVTLLKAYDPYNTLATASVDGYGHWTTQIDTPLPISPPNFTLTGYQTIEGKRSYWLENRVITVVVTPDPPVIESPLANADTNRHPIVSGTGVAGAVIVLLEQNKPYVTLASTIVDGHGKWSVTLERPLPLSPPKFNMTGYQHIDGVRSGWISNLPLNVTGP